MITDIYITLIFQWLSHRLCMILYQLQQFCTVFNYDRMTETSEYRRIWQWLWLIWKHCPIISLKGLWTKAERHTPIWDTYIFQMHSLQLCIPHWPQCLFIAVNIYVVKLITLSEFFACILLNIHCIWEMFQMKIVAFNEICILCTNFFVQ